jgi:hypothetical protein
MAITVTKPGPSSFPGKQRPTNSFLPPLMMVIAMATTPLARLTPLIHLHDVDQELAQQQLDAMKKAK